MIVYHRTDPVSAARIQETKSWASKEHDGSVYFSNRSSGQAEGYGDAVVEVDVPESSLMLDDEFPDGEKHYRVYVGNLAGLPARISFGS